MALARHVAYVHRNLKNPEDSQAVRAELPDRQIDSEVLTIGRCGMSHGGNRHVQPVVISRQTFDSNFLKHYVAEARQFEPHVPKELTAFIVNEYVQLRSVRAAARSTLSVLPMRS